VIYPITLEQHNLYLLCSKVVIRNKFFINQKRAGILGYLTTRVVMDSEVKVNVVEVKEILEELLK